MLKLSNWVEINEMAYSHNADKLEFQFRGPLRSGSKIGDTGLDAHLHHAGGVHGLEIGMDNKDFHQIYCKYDSNSGWSAAHKNPVIHKYINGGMGVVGSRKTTLAAHLTDHFGHGHKDTKRTEFNHRLKQMDKRSYTAGALAVQDGAGFQITNIPDDVIRQSYKSVGKDYVYMKNKGLFRTGKDVAKLGVPLLATNAGSSGFVLNMRPKPGKRNSEGFRHHNAVAQIKLESNKALREHEPTRTVEQAITHLKSKGVGVGSERGGTPASHIASHQAENNVDLGHMDHLHINHHS